MFRGLHSICLDNKGRLAVPSRYRSTLSETAEGKVVVTIDTELACLLLYPLPQWEIIEKKLEALPSFNRAARRIQRLLIGHATELECDGQGRILLPQPLREYAKLDKCVVFVGQGKKFEIWDEESWNSHRAAWLTESAAGEDTLPDDVQTLAL